MLIIPPHRIPVPFPLPSLDRVVMAERKSTLSSPSDVSASPSASKCHSLPQVMDSHAPKRPDDAPSVGKDDSIEVEQSPEGTPQTPQGSPQLSTEGADEGDSLSKQSGPVQKRRRVTRACDECRRKKIKCDGNQPCTHCTVYSYDCTYHQPSNRRRNAAPQYVEALESQLKRATAIIRSIFPNADLNDPDLDLKIRHFIFPQSPPTHGPTVEARAQKPSSLEDAPLDDHLESMVKATGQLDLDEKGHLEYHGHSSGLSFIRRMREQLGSVMGQEGQGTPFVKSRIMPQEFYPKSAENSPKPLKVSSLDLPPREQAQALAHVAINEAALLMRFVHYPTFIKQMERLYEAGQGTLDEKDANFVPLLFAVFAFGTLFSTEKGDEHADQGYAFSIDEGFKYFRKARSLLDVADCRKLVQIQALLFMILFLQSTAKLSECYAYIGIAMRVALRLGLHRSFSGAFDSIETETRKRVFWIIKKMDIYVGALLGLPWALDDEDVDQEYPIAVDDDFISESGILPMPEGHISVIAAGNAHTEIMQILAKIIRYIYPIKGSDLRGSERGPLKSYKVRYSKIQEIERDLQQWQDRLPTGLKPGGEGPIDIMRSQRLLRMAYAHAQMMMYRPFLHYVSRSATGHIVDNRSYACAAMCVTVSQNIIHIAGEMHKRGLLITAYWFTLYTTFFAILSLVFYALENPENDATREVLKVAKEGRELLQGLSKSSLAADRCSATLDSVFEKMPERLRQNRQSTSTTRKRRQEHSPQSSLSVKTPHIKVEGQKALSPHSRAREIISDRYTMETFGQQPYEAYGYGEQTGPGFFDAQQALPGTGSVGSFPTTHPQARESFPESQETSFVRQNFPLADFSAIMFPSADPFAYPNQTTLPNQSYELLMRQHAMARTGPFPQGPHLESRQSHQSLHPDSPHSPHATLFYGSPVPGFPGNRSQRSSPTDRETQLLGPYPMYVMQGANHPQDPRSVTTAPRSAPSSVPSSRFFFPPTSSSLDPQHTAEDTTINVEGVGILSAPSTFVEPQTASQSQAVHTQGEFEHSGQATTLIPSEPSNPQSQSLSHHPEFEDMSPEMLQWSLGFR